MERLHYIGTSHRLVPPKALGALPEAEILEAELLALQAEGLILGSVLLATCNRFELYVEAPEGGLEAFVEARFGSWFGSLAFETLEGRDAALHLIRTAGSLDSMVLGENQILAQVKAAWERARKEGRCSSRLETMFRQAVQGTKEIRSETGLGLKPVSVASLAARHLAVVLHGRSRPRIALIGAGEMIRKAAPALALVPGVELLFVNRSVDKAQALADKHGGEVRSLGDFLQDGEALDGLVIAVRAEAPLIGEAELARLGGDPEHPLRLVDLSVPGMIDLPEQGPRHRLLDMDRLRTVSEAHAAERREAADQAEPIAEAHVDKLEARLAERILDLGSVRERHLALAEEEAEERLGREFGHLPSEDRERVRRALLDVARSHAHLHMKELRSLSKDRLAQERSPRVRIGQS